MSNDVISAINTIEWRQADQLRHCYDWIQFCKRDLENDDKIAFQISYLRAKAHLRELEDLVND
jgi:hypothetical protein